MADEPTVPHEEGLEIRRQILGEEWVTTTKRLSPGLAAFTEQAIDHIWCTIWPRTTLELRIKSACTMSALIALGAHDELLPHAAGAVRAGLFTKEEVRAIALHVTPYVGYPAGRDAMKTIDQALAPYDDQPGTER